MDLVLEILKCWMLIADTIIKEECAVLPQNFVVPFLQMMGRWHHPGLRIQKLHESKADVNTWKNLLKHIKQ